MLFSKKVELGLFCAREQGPRFCERGRLYLINGASVIGVFMPEWY